MTTRNIFNGKPCAGNPRVRFDEGDVALAATPRRGSLLHNMRKTMVLAAVATCAVIARGDAVTVSVDGTRPGRTLPNAQQTLTLWHLAPGAYTNTVRNAEWDVTEFAEYVEIMGATGGSPERDCLRNPDDRTVLDDYDFSRLVSGCRNIVRLGLKPYLKLGNVPGKFTSDYNGGDFAMNVRPPTDESAYARYMAACAKALLDAFGREELLKWRFAVLTEYENAGWFKAASGKAEETFRAYCRLYELTAAAFTGTISPDITIGAHAMAVTEGLWDERRFIRYAAEHKLPLKFVTASFYDSRPGKFTSGMSLPRTIAHLRDAAVSAGLTNLFYGVDEGRILDGNANGSDGRPLGLRVVGDTFQAAYDARTVKQIFDSGAEYFAAWGYLSGPDTFFEGLPSVSFHVARESARFKDMRRLSVTTSGSARKEVEADAVAALSPDGGVLRIMAYAFRNEQFAKGVTPFRIAVKLPAGWAECEIAVTRKLVDDDANWFDEWRAERTKRKIGNDRFAWSPDDPAPMKEHTGLKTKADRELFLKEVEPKLRAYAKLRSHTERMRAPGGELSLDCTLPDNAVLFIELSRSTRRLQNNERTLVSSPDGKNEIRLYANPLAYEVVRDGVTVVAKSEIGMTVDGARLGGADAAARAVPDVKRGTRSGVVDALVYKKAKVDLSANEAFADFGAWGVRLVARNDGVAYRFETKMPGRIRVESEDASLAPPTSDAHCWGYPTGGFGQEESVPFSLKASQIDFSHKKLRMPLGVGMVYLPFAYEAAGKFVLVMESDVRDYPILNFGPYGNGAFAAKFAGAPKRVQKMGAGIRVLEHEKWLVETEGARTFPWRVFALADAPAKFCEADVVWALAPAQEKGADFSWVRPGKVAWDWWNGFDNGRKCDTKGYERFIDFAAKNGLEYVVLDWYGYEVRFGFDIWKPCPVVDVDHLVKYAKERGVDLWHWMAFHQVYGDEERVASHFAKAGIKGFKVDFLDRGDADVARFMEKFADACARNRMHVEYHGASRPTGLHRRYPNVLNYEGIHGQEWMLPGLYKGDEKGWMFSDVAACYLRMSAGPMDYTPGAMLNHGIGSGYRARDRRNLPGTLGTRCRQMAQVALYEAPLQMLCDSPTNYEKNMECFAFMAKIPTVWKNTVGLAGTPDTMFVAARETRDGAWYAGGITTAEARDCTLDTSFLGMGEWTAEMFGDAGDAKEDAQRYVHETRKIKAGEKISVHMAPGGGFVIRFAR